MKMVHSFCQRTTKHSTKYTIIGCLPIYEHELHDSFSKTDKTVFFNFDSINKKMGIHFIVNRLSEKRSL